ncbi:MAG: nucleotidyltransferase family protein [Candidatus Omnitrophica bacterium]|nr:nucleotidyltransferase family protein [Candidatus Omnitrophota bacterium]
MQDKESVLKTIRDHQTDIRKLGVKRLGLFGSFVRGKQNVSSDLDFAVELEPKTFDSYMNLKHYLEDLFGCRVDLVLFSAIKPRLKTRILQDLVDAA